MRFEYSRLLQPFVDAFGKENVLVRPYGASANPMAPFQDFIAIFQAIDSNFGRDPVNVRLQTRKSNESLSFGQLLYHAYKGLRSQAEGEIETHVRAGLHEVAPGLEFFKRFRADNEFLERQYGVPLLPLAAAAIPGEADPHWAQTRLQRRVYDCLLRHWTTVA